MTEKEKMISGKIYRSGDDELLKLRCKAHSLCTEYNATFENEKEKRKEMLKDLLGSDEVPYLQGPIQFDYGVFTTFGKFCYANFNLTILDCAPVTIGNNVLIGPNCSLVTPIHPMMAEERCVQFEEDGTMYEIERAEPIVIGDDCWLASNVTVCGGVTIGNGTVIGAGSVVTRDIPSGVFAAGNPCRVIRAITEEDSVLKRKELFE